MLIKFAMKRSADGPPAAETPALRRQPSESILVMMQTAENIGRDTGADPSEPNTWTDTEVAVSLPSAGAITPTEPDSDTATIIDLDESQVQIAEHEQDSLVQLALDPPVEPSSEESWDSQLTQNERLNEPQADRVPLYQRILDAAEATPAQDVGRRRHWSKDLAFAQGVSDTLAMCRGQSWFESNLGAVDLADRQLCFDSAVDFINSKKHRWSTFKIGICENPYLRWTDQAIGGYAWDPRHDWVFMAILYAAPTSKHRILQTMGDDAKALRMASTGRMEIDLIDVFHADAACLNREGGGGDCPSDGSPHFLYVVAELCM